MKLRSLCVILCGAIGWLSVNADEVIQLKNNVLQDFSIHLISSDTSQVDEMDLLPLAGSWQHQQQKEETDEEDRKYFLQDNLPVDVTEAMEQVEMLRRSQLNQDQEVYRLLTEAAWKGSIPAQEQVAMQYLYGQHLQRNLSGAKDMFGILNERGHPLGQMGLGFLHSTGLDLDKPSQPKALLYYTFAALGGNSFAQMALGYRYLHGVNVESNCEQALRYYRKAAARVADHVPVTGGPTIQKIRLYEEWENPGVNNNLDDDLLQYYTFVAEKGDSQAQMILGQLYLSGSRGLEQDRRKALAFFKRAADGGSVNALGFLGRMHLEGSPTVPQNNETAMEYFKKAADAGNSMGQAGLGLMYLYGRGVEADFSLAFKYFKLAADQSSVDGQLHLGIMTFHGFGTNRDIPKAVKLLNQASQGGSVLAIYYLAEINANGIGVSRSCRTAAELFKNVAERGRWGMYFGSAFADYKSKDIDSALLKYLLLADLGYETAQSNVAFLLDSVDSSLFPNEDAYPRAIVYWERSAKQGYHIAKLKLGDYHFYGYGTEVDYEAAVKSYREAEHSNSPQALFNLGYMYQRGFGVKQDLHLAKRFYDRAAELHSDAYVPVLLALISVGGLYAWQKITSGFDTLAVTEFSVETLLEFISLNWDVLLALVLVFFLMGVLVTINRLTAELTRQRAQLSRRNQTSAVPPNAPPPPVRPPQ